MVSQVIERLINREKAGCNVMCNASKNAIEEMFLVIERNTQQMTQMKANIVYDLQKYHRDAWDMMREFQQGFLTQLVQANLERGVSEGLYRDDFDIDIVTRIHIASTFQLFDETIFPRKIFKREVIFTEYLLHYLHGILSEKGRKFLKKHANKISQ